MKRFITIFIILCFLIFTACGSKDNLLPESFESKFKMQAKLEYTCQYDVDQDAENELIGCYSHEKSIVKTYLVYDESNGIQEYTGGPGADNFRYTCVIKDLNISETYMAMVSMGGLACKVMRFKTPEEQNSIVEAWRETTAEGEIVNSYYCNGEESNKESVLEYFQNLKVIEPTDANKFSSESLKYWFD